MMSSDALPDPMESLVFLVEDVNQRSLTLEHQDRESRICLKEAREKLSQVQKSLAEYKVKTSNLVESSLALKEGLEAQKELLGDLDESINAEADRIADANLAGMVASLELQESKRKVTLAEARYEDRMIDVSILFCSSDKNISISQDSSEN